MINTRPFPRKSWEPQPDKPQPRLSPLPRTKAMTVCIAAICTWHGDDLDFASVGLSKWMCAPKPYIIGISDRKVSTRHSQSELPQPKFRKTVNSVMVMMAGVNAVAAEIFDKTDSDIWEDFTGNERVIPVKEIADCYSENLITFLNNRKDKICRARIGFTFKDFLSKYNTLPEPLRQEILYEINDEDGDETGTQTIITGIDESGAHIFAIDARGVISPKDAIGFAIIGSGTIHSHSQIMCTKHSPAASYIDTLLLTYMAKKQAEIDPGVGKEYTDIFVIKDDQTCGRLTEKTVKMLRDTYNDIYDKVLKDAKTKIEEHLIKERKDREKVDDGLFAIEVIDDL